MRPTHASLLLLLAATCSCQPRIPNPVDIAKVAIDGSFLVLDETGRAVRAARTASEQARAARSGDRPEIQANPGVAPPPGAPLGPLPEVVPPSPAHVVETRFLGEGGESHWLVRSAGRELCQTPCTLRYPEGTGLSLVQTGGPRKPPRLDVPFLRRGAYEVSARPRIMGAFAPGVVAASFGGMGAVAGLAVTAVGCSQSDDGMCRGGAIPLGVTAAVLTTGILLVSASSPRLRIESRPASE
jgi:hypothetical protein